VYVLQVPRKYYGIEQIFYKIHERLMTGEWLINIYHGNIQVILKFFEDTEKNALMYDFSQDEVWIEKSPGMKLPSNFRYTPIVVACLKKEPEIEYEKYTIDTPIGERKDISQYAMGEQGQLAEDLESDVYFKIITDWFSTRLQYFIDKKNGRNPKLDHVSSSTIQSLDTEFRALALCQTIRLHSVWAYGMAENEFAKEFKKVGGMLIINEEDVISKERINSILELLELSLFLDNLNFASWHWKGFMLYKRGNYEEAGQCFESAGIINPHWYESIFYEGKMLVLRGFPHLGLAKMDEALKYQPNKISFIVLRANVLQSLEKYEDAIEGYKKAQMVFEKEGNFPIDYLQFILYQEFVSLQKINRLKESMEVLEALRLTFRDDRIDKLSNNSFNESKKASPQQLLDIEKEIGDIKDFVLSKDGKENIRKLLEILKKLKEFLYWSDQYFSQKAFEWIQEACLGNNSIKDIKILSGTGKKDEILGRPFKRKIERLQRFLAEKKVDFNFKLVVDEELKKRHHGRFIISKDAILSIPSIDNFTAGTMDTVSKTNISKEDIEFDKWWEKSIDFFQYREMNKVQNDASLNSNREEIEK